jgi:hypothetical protein
MRYFLKSLSIFYLFTVLFCSICIGAIPETGKLVPKETIALVNINDFSRTRANFEKTDIYQLYKDPSMKAFVEDAKEKLRLKAREKESDILESLMESEITPEGRMFFALVHNEKAQSEQEPQALFLIQFGGNIEKAKELVTDIVSNAIDSGARQNEEDYRSVSLNTIIKDDGRFDYGFSSTMSYCFIDDFLIVSEDSEMVRFCIAHLQGASGSSLSEESDYSNALGSMGAEHDVFFYVNLKHIIRIQTERDQTGQAQTAIVNLGIDNLSCVCGFVDISSRPESFWFGRVMVKVNGEKKGILKMFDVERSSFQAPRFVPSSMNSVSFLNIDIQKAFQELSNIMTAFSPQQAALLYMPIPLDNEGENVFELKRDFIDHMGSQVLVTTGFETTEDEEDAPRNLIALRTQNSQALEKSLSALHYRFIGSLRPDSKREILGHTLYRLGYSFIPLPTPPGETMQSPSDTKQPPFPVMAFTVTDTHLIFGQEDTVERSIRTLSSSEDLSVGTSEWFEAAKSALPSAVGFAGMEDLSTTGKNLWKMFKEVKEPEDITSSVEFGVGIDSATGPLPGLMLSQRLFDTRLLPEFDVVKKYFGLYVNYLISEPEGYMFEFKTLKSLTR